MCEEPRFTRTVDAGDVSGWGTGLGRTTVVTLR